MLSSCRALEQSALQGVLHTRVLLSSNTFDDISFFKPHLLKSRESYDQEPWAQLEAWVRVNWPGAGEVLYRWSGSVRHSVCVPALFTVQAGSWNTVRCLRRRWHDRQLCHGCLLAPRQEPTTVPDVTRLPSNQSCLGFSFCPAILTRDQDANACRRCSRRSRFTSSASTRWTPPAAHTLPPVTLGR